ncbi:MAG: ferrous iron transport protein A [Turicibacter sp.]|nr:ferrous iron transport protein A [Turicibacter sp.]
MTLATLNKGEHAIILEFNGLSASFSQRLYDVGISIGAEVTLLKVLNFGQLFYISIDDVHFCIRKEDAKQISVEKLS